MPAMIPPTRNTASEVATAPAAMAPRPRTMAATAPITCWPAGRRDSETWDRAAAAKTLKVTSPAVSSDLSCIGPATKVGAREVNSPKIAKEANAAIAAPRNSARDASGIAKRWGRYGGRGMSRRTVSGTQQRHGRGER